VKCIRTLAPWCTESSALAIWAIILGWLAVISFCATWVLVAADFLVNGVQPGREESLLDFVESVLFVAPIPLAIGGLVTSCPASARSGYPKAVELSRSLCAALLLLYGFFFGLGILSGEL
jgi:hypothetical protein